MNSFEILKSKYQEINKKGFIKSINNYKNGAGLTIEHELKSTGGDFNIPDFMDIEIKTVYKYRDADIELFNSAPDGSHFPAALWVSNNYGYPDNKYKNIKVFKGNIYGNKKNYIGNKYEFQLRINRTSKRIELFVYKNNMLINNDIYWDFDTLKEKLERKDNKVGVFKFIRKCINNEWYYKYEKLYLYKLKSFKTFLDLIEKGIIFVTFKVDVHKSGKYIGKISDHGTSFRIYFGNMHKLFYKYY
ncbi:MAG: hypothetical protein IKX00_04445 [Bacilli bacterium]|nr:hypothetical protein [Bacilli bacterium]